MLHEKIDNFLRHTFRCTEHQFALDGAKFHEKLHHRAYKPSPCLFYTSIGEADRASICFSEEFQSGY
jgi:hypothetical protein